MYNLEQWFLIYESSSVFRCCYLQLMIFNNKFFKKFSNLKI